MNNIYILSIPSILMKPSDMSNTYAIDVVLTNRSASAGFSLGQQLPSRSRPRVGFTQIVSRNLRPIIGLSGLSPMMRLSHGFT